MTESFRPVLVIHGGAGAISKEVITTEQATNYTQSLANIAKAGIGIIENGGSAVDAVTHAVSLLEDCELFNAGKGSVFTADETHELDAAIMDGLTLKTGAVSIVNRIKNPVQAARAVLRHSHHAFFVGEGAHRFAKEHGLELVSPDFFNTEFRYEQLLHLKKTNTKKAVLDHNAQTLTSKRKAPLDENNKMGTVGAVALDSYGNLAAATSTGGLTNKQIGRVGDTPIIGAGTYANNRTCAVSCTGEGERFIELVAAYDISALIEYCQLTIDEAAHKVIEKLTAINGVGGLIAVDTQGNISLPFNSGGMYRAFAYQNEEPRVAIYDEEPFCI